MWPFSKGRERHRGTMPTMRRSLMREPSLQWGRVAHPWETGGGSPRFHCEHNLAQQCPTPQGGRSGHRSLLTSSKKSLFLDLRKQLYMCTYKYTIQTCIHMYLHVNLSVSSSLHHAHVNLNAYMQTFVHMPRCTPMYTLTCVPHIHGLCLVPTHTPGTQGVPKGIPQSSAAPHGRMFISCDGQHGAAVGRSRMYSQGLLERWLPALGSGETVPLSFLCRTLLSVMALWPGVPSWSQPTMQ